MTGKGAHLHTFRLLSFLESVVGMRQATCKTLKLFPESKNYLIPRNTLEKMGRSSMPESDRFGFRHLSVTGKLYELGEVTPKKVRLLNQDANPSGLFRLKEKRNINFSSLLL